MNHPEIWDRRRERLLNGLKVGDLRGAEIGPLSRPIVKRQESEIYYIDHCSTEDLKRKYAGHDVAADEIAEVDFIWGEESLAKLLGDKAPLDYIIASHVIEHVPDLCGWLKEVADALKVGGRLLLVVPDKRFTFDLFRRLSSFEEVIAAWIEHRRRPGLRPIMDHFANVVTTNLHKLWDEPEIYEHLHYVHGPEYLELAQREFAEGKYIDVHCWVFTPWHFMKLMGRMVKEMKLPFDLRYFLTTQYHDLEFYVQLEKVDNPSTHWEEEAHRAQREAETARGGAGARFNSPFPAISKGRNEEFFIAAIPKGGKVLEIGGGYNPVVTRELGFNCFSVDHASQETLIEKYTKLIDASTAAKIQPVDFICEDGDLQKSIPASHLDTFDICISSHNIEHIPNPIAQLQAIARLLKENGRFLLAVPDKTACFDLMRPVTTTASWVQAYYSHPQRHSIKTRFEYEAYVISLNRSVTWSPGAVVDKTKFASALNIREVANKVMAEDEFVDCHAWVFTPSSFLLIIYELHSIGLISFLPSALYTNNGEFLVSLEKKPEALISNAERMRLLKQSCLEQAEGLSKIVLEPQTSFAGQVNPDRLGLVSVSPEPLNQGSSRA